MADEPSQRWSDSMADAYERWLVPTVFEPFAADLARRVARRHPGRVLELAAGTGVLTRALLVALPAAQIVASDLSAAMVDLGSRRAPEASWRQADALHLPFDDGAFDVLACQFGVMFFPDKTAGFAEIARVLAPNGALIFNTWGPLEDHAFQTALVAALGRVLPADPPRFMIEGPHGYADAAVIGNDLRAGGFGRAALEELTLDGHAPSVEDLAVGYCRGTPLRGELERRGDLDGLTARIAQDMVRQLGSGPCDGGMTAVVAEVELP